ncbi:LamG-like jellyroll fold domain-containing protein [Verrucomicrobiaceae bacterium 227]
MTSSEKKLITRIVDETATADEEEIFRDLIDRDAEARRCYCSEMDLCSALDWHFSSAAPSLTSTPKKRRLVDDIRRLQFLRESWYATAVALTILLILGAYSSFRYLDARPSASLKANQTAEWTISRLEGDNPSGNLKKGDSLELTAGALELTLKHDSRLILEAPASLTFEDTNQLTLNSGTLYVEITGPKGEGFTVTTPSFTVTDLGTRFGIHSSIDQPDEIHVHEGLVEASVNGSTTSISAGKAFIIAPGFPKGLRPITFHGESFFNELPEASRPLALSFDDWAGDGAPLAKSPNLDLRTHLVGTPAHPSLEIVEGHRGKAAKFNGDGSSLRITGWHGIEGNSPRTVAFWIKLPSRKLLSSMTYPIIAWGSSSNREHKNWGLCIERHLANLSKPTAGALRFSDGQSSGGVAGPDLRDDRWHHLAVTYQPGIDSSLLTGTRIYLDGKEVEIQELEDSQVDTLSTDTLFIGSHVEGKRSNFAPFIGTLDELQIFRKTLTAREIRRLIETNSIHSR